MWQTHEVTGVDPASWPGQAGAGWTLGAGAAGTEVSSRGAAGGRRFYGCRAGAGAPGAGPGGCRFGGRGHAPGQTVSRAPPAPRQLGEGSRAPAPREAPVRARGRSRGRLMGLGGTLGRTGYSADLEVKPDPRQNQALFALFNRVTGGGCARRSGSRPVCILNLGSCSDKNIHIFSKLKHLERNSWCLFTRKNAGDPQGTV